MRVLAAVLAVTILLGVGFVVLVVTDSVPLLDASDEPAATPSPGASAGRPFDAASAFRRIERQVEIGPRPAGSPASRRLAEELVDELPGGAFEPVPGGLRNIVGEIPGRDPDRVVVLGAHYDTKDLPGFLGANDGASGTATVVELARTIEPRELEPTVKVILFDGEESPAGTPDEEFETAGLRGSRAAAPAYADAEAMILLDFVGDTELTIPREENSDPELWSKLRGAAAEAGHADVFPRASAPAISDDQVPFLRAGVPAIDLIDFEFDCFHETCDDLDAVSPDSVEAVGESVLELLRTL